MIRRLFKLKAADPSEESATVQKAFERIPRTGRRAGLCMVSCSTSLNFRLALLDAVPVTAMVFQASWRGLVCAQHREAQKPNWRRPSQNADVAKAGEFSEVRMPAEYAHL